MDEPLNSPEVLNVAETIASLRFVGDRKPMSTKADLEGAFAKLSTYRDGGIFVGHYAGNSEWERHPIGDEIVFVLEGQTTLILLIDEVEQPNLLTAGKMLIVPANTWHRFETPDGVKIMSVTPQPGDHCVDHPLSSAADF
ncbi:MAG: cupin domain-containing protein [Pseudomonadota bacterium]